MPMDKEGERNVTRTGTFREGETGGQGDTEDPYSPQETAGCSR